MMIVTRDQQTSEQFDQSGSTKPFFKTSEPWIFWTGSPTEVNRYPNQLQQCVFQGSKELCRFVWAVLAALPDEIMGPRNEKKLMQSRKPRSSS